MAFSFLASGTRRQSGLFRAQGGGYGGRKHRNRDRDMDEVEWWEFATPAEPAEQIAGDVPFVIESAVEAHGGARTALTGGRTHGVVSEGLLNKEIDGPPATLLPPHSRERRVGQECE